MKDAITNHAWLVMYLVGLFIGYMSGIAMGWEMRGKQRKNTNDAA